jgi:hypothetical protein
MQLRTPAKPSLYALVLSWLDPKPEILPIYPRAHVTLVHIVSQAAYKYEVYLSIHQRTTSHRSDMVHVMSPVLPSSPMPKKDSIIAGTTRRLHQNIDARSGKENRLRATMEAARVVLDAGRVL